MATPASGTISMDNMRDEITRSTGSVSMQEIRTRAGRSGAISFNQMYDCEGWVQTNGQYVSKYFTVNGWNSFIGPIGSVSPDEGSGTIVIISTGNGSKIISNSKSTAVANNILQMANNTSGSTFASGYGPANITRIVFGNTTGTLGPAGASDRQWSGVTIPSSGTSHCMVQF